MASDSTSPAERLARRALKRLIAGRSSGIVDGGEPLLRIFLALSETRRSDFGHPQPIGFPEIEAYARLMRWPLEPGHVEVIRALDREWIAAFGSGKSGKSRRGSKLTPAAFDAVF